MNLDNTENDIKDNMIYIFKCVNDSFKPKKLKNDECFILSIIFIGVQIICFIFLSICTFSNSLKILPLNPPKKIVEQNYNSKYSRGSKYNRNSKQNFEYSNNSSYSNNSNYSNKYSIKDKIGSYSVDSGNKNTDKSDRIDENKTSKKNFGKISYELVLDYLDFKNARNDDERTFCYYYCHLLFFNQLILNLFSFCKYSISISFIPFPIKLVRILLLFLINVFINAILANNKYMIDKYNYFNKKYNIENNAINISINEKIVYSIKNGKINILLSLFICLGLQYILACLLNIRRKIAYLLMDEKKISEIEIKILKE